MKTPQEEQYVHFYTCIQNLNDSWWILQKIKEHRGNPLVGPAFQFALIEYSKPYKDSHGSLLNPKGKSTRYKLDDGFVPVEHFDLHTRLLNARDQFHAHADLSLREPSLHVSTTPHGKFASPVQNNIYGTEEIQNIDEIIDLIEKTLDVMYKEEEKLRSLLPATP